MTVFDDLRARVAALENYTPPGIIDLQSQLEQSWQAPGDIITPGSLPLDRLPAGVVAGSFNASGVILSGDGFTVARTALGHYTVTWNAPWAAAPTLVAMTASGAAATSNVSRDTAIPVTAFTYGLLTTDAASSVYIDIETSFIAYGRTT